MKVTLRITKNLLDPNDRVTEELEVEKGTLLRDIIPDYVQEAPSFSVWRNSAPLDRPLVQEAREGDVIAILVYPTGAVVGAATSALGLLSIGGASFAAARHFFRAELPIVDDGSGNNTFSGFRNSYEPGEALPVVYGQIRVAGPCVNQQIETAEGEGILGESEAIRLMFALSEGPIYGLGENVGVVANEDDFAQYLGPFGSLAKNIGLQINGQSADNFTGVGIRWRTGETSQDPINGWEDSSQVVIADQNLDYNSGATETAKPAGTYSAGSEITGDPGTYFSYTMSDVYDRARVHIFFPQGLYTTNGGSFETNDADIRIQYWPVDSGGTRTGDTIVLPVTRITGQQPGGLVYDIPIVLFTPNNYSGAKQIGYYACDTTASDWVELYAPSGAPEEPGGSPVGSVDIAPFVLPDNFLSPVVPGGSPDFVTGDMRFVFESWCRPKALSSNPNGVVMSYGEDPGTSGLTAYPFLDSTPSGGRNGCELSIKYESGSGLVWLVFASWNNSQMNWWRAQIGTILDSSDVWHHVGVAVSVPDNNSAVQTVQLYHNGVPVSTAPGPASANAAGANIYFESNPGAASTAMFYAGRRPGSPSPTNAPSNDNQNRVKIDIATWGLYDGVDASEAAHFLAADALMADRFGSISDAYGWKDGSIPTSAPFLRAGFNAIEDAGGGYLKNEGQPLYPTTPGVAFTMNDATALQAAPQSDTPVYTVETGVALKDYYHIEVFRASTVEADPTVGQNASTVEDVTLFIDEAFEYPSTALLSTRIVADDQVNNARPTVTTIVKGKLCPVWDGISADFPTFNDEWTRNPAWIALDALTNKRYGMGGIFSRTRSLDLPAFLEWAQYCDEGVEDGYGTQSFFAGTYFGSTPTAIYGQVKLSIGIVKLNGQASGSNVPRSWSVGKTLGIKTATSASSPDLAGAYVTTDSDTKLTISSIAYKSDASGANGFQFWAEIVVDWVPNLAPPVVSGDITGTVVGFEPRHTFDGVFDEKELKGWDAVTSIFQAGRAMPVQSGNKVSVFIDRKRNVAGLFGMGNIIAGSLRLSWTGQQSRPNSMEVDFLDEDLNYETTTVDVDHSSVSDPTKFESFRKQRVRMRGLTRRSQVLRDANFRLDQHQELKRTVDFSVGMDAIPVSAGDRIKVSHDVVNLGTSGRLLEGVAGFGNFISSPESMFNGLVGNGGVFDASVAHMEVAGYPTSTTANSDYQAAGPLGYGTADVIRFRAIGNGADASGVARTAGTWDYFEANDSALYPPTANPAVVDYITDDSWAMTVSAYFKEPERGAGERIRFGLRVPTAANGDVVDEELTAEFRWNTATNALDNLATYQGGATATTPVSIGSGWYRADVTWEYANKLGGSAIQVGDPVQVILVPAAPFDTSATGEFIPVSASTTGKGVNFMTAGDPLDLENDAWTKNGSAKATAQDSASSIDPPFYFDQDHGAVWHIEAGQSNGDLDYYENTVTIDDAATNFGSSGVQTTDDFVASFYIRRDDATSSRFRMENPSGDYVEVDVAWPAATLTTTGSGSHTANIAAVKLNSSTNDANWYKLDISFRNLNQDSSYDVQIWPEHQPAAAAGLGIYVWGVMTHGEDSLGNVSPNWWAHRGQYVWGLEAHRRDAVAAYEPGQTIALDRDYTFESGKDYVVEVRATLGIGDNARSIVEQVPISSAEVPGTVTAGNTITTAASFLKFAPRHGDVYAIGELDNSIMDAQVIEVTLDPKTMEREISCVDYVPSIYDAFEVGQVQSTLALTSSSAGNEETSLSIGANSLGGSGVTAIEATRRNSIGNVVNAVRVAWGYAKNLRSIGGARIYIAELDANERPGKFELVADVPRRQSSYTVENYPFKENTSYRAYVQAYGERGLGKPPQSCPSSQFKFWGTVPPSAPPTVTTTTGVGDKTAIRIDKSTTPTLEAEKPTNYEMRVGGWLLGQKVTAVSGSGGTDLSDERYTGPSNTFGEGAPDMVTRGIVPGGQFTRSDISQFDTQQHAWNAVFQYDYADNWTFAGSSMTNLTEVAGSPGYLEFTGSSLTGYFTTQNIQIIGGVHPMRRYVEAWVDADYVREETLGDFGEETIGSRRMHHWTLEGPMSGPASDWAEMRPGIQYMGAATMRIAVTRRSANDNVRIRRFGIVIYDIEPYHADGGDIG
jgi:hypothetical protein